MLAEAATTAAQTVHTTGVNWEAVFAIAASVCTILGVAGFPLAKLALRSLKDAQRDATREVIREEVNPRFDAMNKRIDGVDDKLEALERKDSALDRRVAFLEGVETGRNAEWMTTISKKGSRGQEGQDG